MKPATRPVRRPRTVPRRAGVACAVLALLGAAQAEMALTEASVDVGLGLVDGSARGLFGQYSGLHDRGTTALFGVRYERRDDDSARSFQLEGRNLFGDNRGLDVRWQRQGDWRVTLQADRWLHREVAQPSSGGDLELRRTRLGLTLVKHLSPRWTLEAEARTERKSGQRLFGIGMSCPSLVAPGCGPTTGIQTGWAVLLLPEPVDARTTELSLRMNYAAGAWRLNGGYFGSFYENRLGHLDPTLPAALNNGAGVPLPPSPGLYAILGRPVALAPDNHLHQVDVTGRYALSPTAYLNFKLAYAQARQHQDFVAAGFSDAPAGVDNLGGRVDTTRAQLGLHARPLPALSLSANVRYEDRDDKTPLAAYNVIDGVAYTNRQLPLQRARAALRAHYQFDGDLRGTLGADREDIDRGAFTATSAAAGITALRQKTDETGVFGELRRRMNEQFSAAVRLSGSRRGGSNWLRDNSGLGVTEVADPSDPAAGFATGIFMPTLADRRREQLQLDGQWQPTEELSLQVNGRIGRDRFDAPGVYGVRRNDMDQIGLDAGYALSETWHLNGYLQHGSETLLQGRPGAAFMAYRNRSTAVGLGVEGKLAGKLRLQAQLSHLEDRSVFDQTLDATADGASASLLAASGGLPDIVLRQTTLRLQGSYPLDKQSSLRFDIVHQQATWSDWAWSYAGVPFTDSAGQTVDRPTQQRATFVGVSYVYRWK